MMSHNAVKERVFIAHHFFDRPTACSQSGLLCITGYGVILFFRSVVKLKISSY